MRGSAGNIDGIGRLSLSLLLVAGIVFVLWFVRPDRRADSRPAAPETPAAPASPASHAAASHGAGQSPAADPAERFAAARTPADAARADASARQRGPRVAGAAPLRVPSGRAPPGMAGGGGVPVRGFVSRDAEAVVRTADGSIRLGPDPAGAFPQIGTTPGATAEVSVVYADGDGPREAVLQAEDGGAFAGGGVVRTAPLNDRNALLFAYVVSTQRGHHRVTLRRGADVKALDFWVETGTEQGGTP